MKTFCPKEKKPQSQKLQKNKVLLQINKNLQRRKYQKMNPPQQQLQLQQQLRKFPKVFLFFEQNLHLDFSPSLKLEQILTQYIGEDYIQKVQKINVDEIKEGNLFSLILLTI